MSSETEQKLIKYAEILKVWQEKINLISPQTISNMQERHFLNSKLILPYIPKEANTILDIGSGAGFPGMVLAILTNKKTFLVESDNKKCMFLNEVRRKLGLENVEILENRIEKLNIKSDVVTARAVADLKTLWNYAKPILNTNGIAIFLKGKNVDEEINDLSKNFNDILSKYNTNSESIIITIKRG